MDYSICQALKRFPRHEQALIIYDICCQWLVHFQERVSESEYLTLSDSLEITGAVGKWHLAAHIPECFPRFTLNFIEGAAQVEGEIVETLWSGLDEIAGLTQAMSIAHRQEVLDDYMNDSNWRKMVRIGKALYSVGQNAALTHDLGDALCGKWIRAKDGISDTQPAFEQLTDHLEPSLIQEWTRQERIAMDRRGDFLDIYNIKSTKCRYHYYSTAEYGLLMDCSTHTGGNTVKIVGNRGSAGKSVWLSVRTYGGPRNREVTVRLHF
jgi:hypothetical protein